jgi:hypothetical protein
MHAARIVSVKRPRRCSLAASNEHEHGRQSVPVPVSSGPGQRAVVSWRSVARRTSGTSRSK